MTIPPALHFRIKMLAKMTSETVDQWCRRVVLEELASATNGTLVLLPTARMEHAEKWRSVPSLGNVALVYAEQIGVVRGSLTTNQWILLVLGNAVAARTLQVDAVELSILRLLSIRRTVLYFAEKQGWSGTAYVEMEKPDRQEIVFYSKSGSVRLSGLPFGGWEILSTGWEKVVTTVTLPASMPFAEIAHEVTVRVIGIK